MKSRAQLGTFLGVYTPTILTILGVIMYLRFGWLLGNIGLHRVLFVVLLANAITLITTLSFSAVATNIRMGGGGAYYIVSRSLGVEVGGAVGLPLFLSQAVSTTLYAFGLAEALRIVLPGLPLQGTAFIIVIVVGVVSFIGAGLALRIQIPLMILIGVSLFGLAWGAFGRYGGGSPSVAAPPVGIGLWTGFAIFFPAVTGVMSGLGLSGDLKNPGRSIPLGSILAVLTGFGVYMIIPFLLSMGTTPEQLRADSLIWTKIAPWGRWVVLPGLFGAIFSSAIGSMLTAPRTLEALARDLKPDKRGTSSKVGRQGLVLGFIVSIAISLGAVLLGDLNAVAPVVSMFFLTVYATLNLSAALESLSGDPSWRPQIRVPWPINLLGALGCIGAMFLIHPLAAGIAFVVEIGIWFFLSRRARVNRWGDARRGLYETLIRWALIRLSRRPMSRRNWRPHLLVFVYDVVEEINLIRFGNWFSQDRGVVTACQLIPGDLSSDRPDLESATRQMQEYLDSQRLIVFGEVNVAQKIESGIVSVAQSNGMAGLQSNTILLGWPQTRQRLLEFIRVMSRLSFLKRSLIIARIRPDGEGIPARPGQKIHIWWGGMHRNGDLMLLLAYLLTLNPEWRQAEVRVMSVASGELVKSRTEKNLGEIISRTRINAQVRVFLKTSDESVIELIHRVSTGADVVFFGLGGSVPGEEEVLADRMENLAGDFPVVFFVKNSSPFTGELLLDENEGSSSDLSGE